MAPLIRTLDFLPEIFQTTTNQQFLGATLDQLVNPPNLEQIQGYVGNRFGYGVNANDYYVTEPDRTRTNYQLDPGIVFTQPNTSTAKDFISYPGIIDAVNQNGGIADNNNRLFNGQFYSWDSFINLDSLINYNQYYWLDVGPPAVTVGAGTVYSTETFVVTPEPSGYQIALAGALGGSINPTITLLRDGVYEFIVNQNTQFWIQGEPGVSGKSANNPNQSVRQILGVNNNGAESGVVTFTVPPADAQNGYNFPGNNLVSVVSNVSYENLNGKPLSSLQNIDGVTSLNGLIVMFYDTGVPNEQGYTSNFLDYTPYAENDNDITAPQNITITSTSSTGNVITCNSTTGMFVNQTVAFTGTPIGTIIPSLTDSQGNITQAVLYYVSEIVSATEFTISLVIGGPVVAMQNATGTMNCQINAMEYEQGYYSVVNSNFYKITYIGDPNNPIISLSVAGQIPVNQKITAVYGNTYGGLNFFLDQYNNIEMIPYISAPLTTLYYQDGTNPDQVGVIKIADTNITNQIDIETEILGKKNYTASNGVVFTNGLKVQFVGDIIPSSYLTGQYYVQGVGVAIELLPVTNFVVPEKFTGDILTPYASTNYDTANYDDSLYIPVTPDYITIAREAINRNAWSRGNRWFHIDVIQATAQYNNDPSILTTYANEQFKAVRPIIEFYPNLRLFNSGTVGKDPIDFIDFRTTDCLNQVAGQYVYYPDVDVYTTYNATLDASSLNVNSGSLVVGQNYVITSTGTTNWNTVAGTTGVTYQAGMIVNVVTTASGTGTANALFTTATVPLDDISGTFAVGMYINDSQNILPPNSQITSLANDGTTLTIGIGYDYNKTISLTNNLSLVANPANNNNYKLFPGARIVFANDPEQNAKIFVTSFSVITAGQPPVITLSEAPDGTIEANNQVVVFRGYNSQGYSYWYNGLVWTQSQEKTNNNQAPLFDVFDSNGISFGNSDVYLGTSFAGCKLIAYGIGTGTNDPILGFPLRYSSVDNIGDISFDISFNSDTFNYVSESNPVTVNVNTGYVYNDIDLTTYERLLGWQTAVGPSVQYQIFEYNWYRDSNPTATFVLDVQPIPSTDSPWPVLQVYVNNVIQNSSNYTVTLGALANGTPITTVTVTVPVEITNTLIQVLVLSNDVSSVAYYQVPINLSNNPLNGNITTANVGDIRRQYVSIFNNCPYITGDVFGNNNYRNLGNIVPYGNAIIQNSASLVLPGTFLRNLDFNLFDSLSYNSKQYINYKNLIVATVNNYPFDQRYDPAYVLNTALDIITATKSNNQSFFWSDMLPAKSPYASNVYTFENNLQVTVYPLSQVYDFSQANYNGVLVYLARTVDNLTTTKQLVRGVDYIVSSTAPSLEIVIELMPGDVVTINEYNQTYGSFVPNTPTKLGLYPAFIPEVVLDSDYSQPTYFIKGHDGSYNKLYGDYIVETDTLVDYRDQALLEFEKRIYNNLKLSNTVPVQLYDILPGYFRNNQYSYQEFIEIYQQGFLNWVGQNRLTYQTQYYSSTDELSWNYRTTNNKLDNSQIGIGYWRGIYQYFYDTFTPNTTPWEMLGYSNEPTWWTSRYGSAPYTSNNLVLWGDLEIGFDYNNGDSRIIPEAVRPGLTTILPVDTQGNLVSPFVSVVGNYYSGSFENNWQVGDVGPVELSYRRSSTWPFDLMRIQALTKPAEFFNLGVWVDDYKYNSEFNQYLVNNRSHLIITDIPVYGNGTPVTSYINWIVDYQKQFGIDGTTTLTELLNNIDVRLVYRLAGYSDQNLLNFYVQSTNPNSNNSSLLIPDASYQVLLYSNPPYEKLIYSSVLVQLTPQYFYSVNGNSQTTAYFNVLKPKNDGQYNFITIDNVTVKVAKNYSDTVEVVPYGTTFINTNQVAQFLASYGAYLVSQGAAYQYQVDSVVVDWQQMIAEYLYWTQVGWSAGATIALNPAAYELTIDKENQIVQPLSLQGINFVLNQNLYPIKNSDLNIVRNGTEFTVAALNKGDTISYGQFNLSNFENAVVFDNYTLFNDTIYDLITGIRQNRIYVRGAKTANWDGTYNASGFIINQTNIQQWDPSLRYTKGEIVLYKNQYWVAQQIVQPSATFQQKYWMISNYGQIQNGLLPNSSTNSLDSTRYYDINSTALNPDANLLGYSLIGYRPRDYAALVDLTDETQVNVYQNLIKTKGSTNAVSAFVGANLPQGSINYNVYENWAIQTSKYGGVLNNNFIQFKLDAAQLAGNPFIVGLTDGVSIPGVEQEVPLYSLYNFSKPVNDVNVLPTIPYAPSVLLPDAGYVNYNDVKMVSYFYSQLGSAVNQQGTLVPLSNFYVGDYVWIANYLNKWNVYTPIAINQVINVQNNLNSTCVVTFATPHNLQQYDLFAIVNFNTNVNGYYSVLNVVSLTQVTISLSLSTTTRAINGIGVGMMLSSQRVSTPGDIANLPLLAFEFEPNTVWVDTNTDGGWAVYQKTLNYNYEQEINHAETLAFGAAVLYNELLGGYLISDNKLGEVYRYDYNVITTNYDIFQTLTGSDVSYGTSMVNEGLTYVISQPTGTPKIYIYTLNNSILSDYLIETQEIAAPGGATVFGNSLALSNDTNWLYVGDSADNKVYVYRKQNIPLQAGYFVAGETYIITSVGTTNFKTICATPITNTVGTIFVATGAGSGTGTATQISYKYSTVIDGSLFSSSGDKFGNSIATDYYGDTVVIGAPGVEYVPSTISNWGSSYVYQRSVQNFVAQFTNIDIISKFNLAWTPTHVDRTANAVSSGTIIQCNADMTGFSVNQPVMFTAFTTPTVAGSFVVGVTYTIDSVGTTDFTAIGAGSNNVGVVFTATGVGSGTGTALASVNFGNSGVVPYVVYYINSISGSNITIKTSRSSTTPVSLTNATGLYFNVNVQTDPLYVSVNGNLVDDSNYAVAGSTLIYTGQLTAGDIVNVSDNVFTKVQSLTTESTPEVGVQFGNSVDTTAYGTEIIVGAPFELTTQLVEGAVYRFTNSGGRFGTITGTSAVNLTQQRTILINGFEAVLPVGDAASAAQAIIQANIINVTASASNNILTISIINNDLAQANEKLLISTLDSAALTELGITPYTLTQTILCPHEDGATQFGTTVKFNEYGSFVASAPVGTRYEDTTFDNIQYPDNDTIFDNNTTQFIDTFPNAGAVYMFDYLEDFNETINNVGNFVYAQSVNANDLVYGNQPMYGTALDFVGNRVVIGSSKFAGIPNNFNDSFTLGYGQVVTYVNTVGTQDWSVLRQTSSIVDINRIGYTQIFNSQNNQTLLHLDYFDPLQGKLFGIVAENIDVVSQIDPASYNNGNVTQQSVVWGKEKVGNIWFNTSNVRFVNYHQNDVTYNSAYWGTVFPGSDVAVYSWIESAVPPSSYQGPGIPYNTNLFSIETILNSSQEATVVYYFWVRNSSIIFENIGKTLSDNTIATYIAYPFYSGISYLAPVLPSVFSVYNSQQLLNGNTSVLNIGYSTGKTDDEYHSEYALIKQNYYEDFLPGLPTLETPEPTLLYRRFLYSLSGVDGLGQVVPDPFLPLAVQTGISARPRQSFFLDRFIALQNYILFANSTLAQYPIAETRENATFLFASGEFYNTQDYWTYVNWWAPGYDDSVRANVVVSIYADLSTLTVADKTIAKVQKNGKGLNEWYIYSSATDSWIRIGLQNGTIQFSSSLYDYASAGYGWAGNFYGTSSYDNYPSEETYWIIRALNEQIYTSELLIYRNQSLILMFEYIQSEATSSQNYLTWLNKTSLVDVSHNIRNLLPLENYQSDNQDFLSKYLTEALPFHVFIKNFTYVYTGNELYAGTLTDFDLPAGYNSTIEQFVSPELVYENPDNTTTYLPTAEIWQEQQYNDWFENYGVSLTGQTDVTITTLKAYISLGSSFIVVDNASGFPINGVITIGTEQIAYGHVDRATNVLSQLIRGYNQTTVQTHLPGSDIIIDLPAVLLLNGSRGYQNPPRVLAYIDTSIYPAPKEAAVLEAVMSLDTVVGVNVINPGRGYAVLPEIIFDTAVTVPFSSNNVNILNNTIQIYAPQFQTGDLIKYLSDPNGVNVGGLQNNQWYYLNVLETVPAIIVALYENYADCVNDTNRINILSTGTGNNHTLNLTARASAVSTAVPVRENIVTLKYDRTTYNTKVTDWKADAFYGSFFAGDLLNVEQVSSSDLSLQNSQPPISSILASAHGAGFEIVSVGNNQQVEWSSSVRYVYATVSATNSVSLKLDSGNLENASGSTIGMTVDMPVQFAGSVGNSGLSVGIVYYVKEILSLTDFTISATVGGPTLSLNNQIISVAGCSMFVAQVVNTATLTVNYPGIRQVTSTTANGYVNRGYFTIPLNSTGTGGTTGFYIGLPVFFVGDVFGGVIENVTYYVHTILDKQNFTLSQTTDLTTFGVVSASSSTKYVTLETTVGLSVNEPFVINDAIINGTASSTFGNISSSTIYYVSQIINSTQITISTQYNGNVFDPGNVSANDETSATLTSQSDTLLLSSATGSMTINLSLPVSPGQVQNQLFTLYQTSKQYAGITSGVISNQLSGNINAILTTTNYVSVNSTNHMYVNMPFTVGSGFNGLSAGLYYVSTIGNISVTVTNTSSTGNLLTCSNTDVLYPGMPIIFTGVSLGTVVIGQQYFVFTITDSQHFTISYTPIKTVKITGSNTSQFTCDSTLNLAPETPITFVADVTGGVTKNTEYYVKTIVDLTHFTISATPGGSALTLTSSSPTYPMIGFIDYSESVLQNDNGLMIGTGTPYITLETGNPLSTTPTPVTISHTEFGPVTYEQTPVSTPSFSVSYVIGGYNAIIESAGQGFAIDNIITISGTTITPDGLSPANDITLRVNNIDSYGAILSVQVSGTPPSDTSNQYYMRVTGTNTFEVYSNPLLTAPVSGLPDVFPYVGFTTTTATATSSSTITVASTSGFNVYDPVVFTGTIFNSNIVLGQTYYIASITPSTSITISNTVGGSAISLGTSSGSMTMAKAGSYAFLPEPFYFQQSVVRFNGQVYICIVSNNDKEFIYGKWQLLDSGSRELNALDRIIGYYQPTVNMPGYGYYQDRAIQLGIPVIDMSQLLTGTIYPYSTYFGNYFQPSLELPVDVELQDKPFYPSQINLAGIIYNGVTYVSPANTSQGAALATNTSDDIWNVTSLTTSNSDITSINFVNNKYLLTTGNSATPILRSVDGITWSSLGYYTSGTTTTLNLAGLTLQDSAYGNGVYVAVGSSIITSTDATNWNQTFTFNNNLTEMLYGVTYVTLNGFTGFVAVGIGQRFDYSTGFTEIVPTDIVLTSTNGSSWNVVPSFAYHGFYSVTANNNTLVAVGQNGAIYTSANGTNWNGINETNIVGVNTNTNVINVGNTSGFTVGETVRFTQSFDVISSSTTYYIKNIVNGTQVQVSLTSGGSAVTLNGTNPTVGLALMYAYPYTTDLTNVNYINGHFVAVGNTGLIKTSTDGITWASQTSGTTQNLTGSTYHSGTYTVVGYDNTVIQSNNLSTWTQTGIFETPSAIYNVTGAPFDFGYGPEELVAGVVSDNLSMIVNTRPGTNWDPTEYAHTGFGVTSIQLTPTTALQTVYSFASAEVQVPSTIAVYVISGSTGLCTKIYNYTVNYINQTVTLSSPLTFGSVTDSLRIDVYEVGNGYQLVKSSTQYNPIVINSNGFETIHTPANYTGEISSGNGVIRPGTQPIEVDALATSSSTNSITVTGISNFTLNKPISFQGTVFGNIVEGTTYYVKSISTITSSITISDTIDNSTGIAGATFALADDIGDMTCIIAGSTGVYWTSPIVYHNGTKLVAGQLNFVSTTISSTNSIVCASVSQLVSGTPVTFDKNIFGGITPLQTYYVKTVNPTNNSFTISATNGGSTFTLSNATGSSSFVTYDYAIGLAKDSLTSDIIFSGNYGSSDYISYTLFGQTTPVQYGYTMPETQIFTGNGSTTVFNLSNYIDTDSSVNAIVEVQGLRVDPSTYTISPAFNNITFNSAPSGTVAVTTYNLTDYQYLYTQSGITNNTVANIVFVNNNVMSVAGTTRITTGIAHNLSTNDIVRLDGIIGSSQLNNNTYYVHVIDSNNFDIYTSSYNMSGANSPVVGVSTYQSGGYAWIDGTYIISDTTATASTVQGEITVSSTNGLQIGTPVYFTTPQGSLGQTVLGAITTGTEYYVNDIVDSTHFYVSTSRYGTNLTLGSTSGQTVNVTQWQQTNVDRLYVTINGYRVPSSSLRVNPGNYISILSTIQQSDSVTITSMVPSATPNMMRYYLNVNRYGVPTVYNANSSTTWLILPVGDLDSTIYVKDVTQLTQTIVQNVVAPSKTNNIIEIPLNVDKRTLSSLTVYNNNTASYLPTSDYYVQLIDLYPYVFITNGVNVGDNLTITALEGNTVYVNGEQIKFTSINGPVQAGYIVKGQTYTIDYIGTTDFTRIGASSNTVGVTFVANDGISSNPNGTQIGTGTGTAVSQNTLCGIQRGANGTAQQTYIPVNTPVLGLLQRNLLPEIYYNQTWNPIPGVYNVTEGDPLQIADTTPATFLQSD